MNSHFNFSRLLGYFKHDLLLHSKRYISFIIGLAIILFFINMFAISQTFATANREDVDLMDFYKETRSATFLLTFIIAMIFVISNSFPALREKSGTMNQLIIPVSTIEKYIVQFSLRIVVFGAIFIIIFGVEFNLAVSIYNSLGLNSIIMAPNFEVFELYPNVNSNEEKVVILSLFSFATYLFACATFFRKNVVLKSIILFGIICTVTYLLSLVYSYLLTPDGVVGFKPLIYERTLSKDFTTIELWFSTLGVFSSLFFLPLSYFNLKEKEA